MQLSFSFPANRNDTFKNLVIDKGNEKSVQVCKEFAKSRNSEPPSLILYGAPGSGKTHLLSAMGNCAREVFDESSTLYLDGARLVGEVDASKTYEELKMYIQNYEDASFLAIDRLELVEGIREAEDQVFHLFNAITQAGGKFCGAVSIPPSGWKFADWLSTRLLWGHVLRIDPVGDENRIDVLIKISSDMGFVLTRQAAQWLITHLPRDPESQIKALEKIDKASLTSGKKASIYLIKRALEDNDVK